MCGDRGMGSLCGLLLSLSPFLSFSVTWGFPLLTYLRGQVCVFPRVCACKDGAAGGAGAGEVGLWVSLGMGQPLGLPEELAKGSLRDKMVICVLEAECGGARWPSFVETQVCGGSPGWVNYLGERAGLQGPSWDAAACEGRQLEGRQPL